MYNMTLSAQLANIDKLQKSEESLYNVLTLNAQNVASGVSSTLTESEINSINDQINTLSASRVNIYNQIAMSYKNQTHHSEEATKALKQQTLTLKLFEIDLNKAKEVLSKLQDEKYNQLKMVEINTYYSKQHDANRRLMRSIVVIGVLILLAVYIKKFIGDRASTGLVTIIIIIGGALTARRVYDMYHRRPDNYDEYDWIFQPTEKNTKDISDAPIFDVSGISMPSVCAASCGEGTMWQNGVGCVPGRASQSY